MEHHPVAGVFGDVSRTAPGGQIQFAQGARPCGCPGWGAAAWKVAPRDQWLGWNAQEREAGLARVLNNARFLILPWIHCRNLASKVLSMSERCVADDFESAIELASTSLSNGKAMECLEKLIEVSNSG